MSDKFEGLVNHSPAGFSNAIWANAVPVKSLLELEALKTRIKDAADKGLVSDVVAAVATLLKTVEKIPPGTWRKFL